jgi:Protein phosphatase 2C
MVSSWSDEFVVAVGSVTGREHTRLHRNNQDGLAARVEPERILTAVCDGCSGGRSSEVGARLGAAWIVASLPRILADRPDEAELASALADDLLDYLRQIAAGLGGSPEVVRDYLLFTFLAAVIEPDRALVIGLGDGLFAADGERRVIDPGPDNAPPYLAYRLVDPALLTAPPDLTPRLHLRAGTLDSLVLATDGAAALSPGELDHPLYARNPSLLQKRLNAAERRLGDDTSLVLVRRAVRGEQP